MFKKRLINSHKVFERSNCIHYWIIVSVVSKLFNLRLLCARWAGSWRIWWTCCVETLQVSPWRWRNAHRVRSPQRLLCSRTWDGNLWRCKYDCFFHPPQICWCMPVSVCEYRCASQCYVCMCVYFCASVPFHVKNKTGPTSDTRPQSEPVSQDIK